MSTTRTDLGKGIIYETLHDGRIHSYRVEQDFNESFTVLFDHLEKVMEETFNYDGMVLTMYDFSGVNVFNRVSRDRGMKLMRSLPDDYRSKTAMILSRSTMGRVIKSVVQTLGRISRNPNVEIRFFFDYESALKWLEKSV